MKKSLTILVPVLLFLLPGGLVFTIIFLAWKRAKIHFYGKTHARASA